MLPVDKEINCKRARFELQFQISHANFNAISSQCSMKNLNSNRGGSLSSPLPPLHQELSAISSWIQKAVRGGGETLNEFLIYIACLSIPYNCNTCKLLVKPVSPFSTLKNTKPHFNYAI